MVKFEFNKHDIALMAAFIALMMVAEVVWVMERPVIRSTVIL
jgi:hypothetical protein